MSKSIPGELAALALGEGAVIRGVRVTRRSLLGFQIGRDTLDAGQAAARLAAGAKGAAARVEVCFRCAGDGLGRRDRGVCGVCHGSGIHVVEPAAGWAEAPPARLAAAVDQVLLALRATRHPRAREALTVLLATLAPLAPPRAYGELRRTTSDAPARPTRVEAGVA